MYYRLGIWHLDLIHKLRPGDNCHRWSTAIPRMVTHNPIDGHSPSKIYQKELYYKLGIWHLNLTHKIKTSWMVSHHHQDGHSPSKGWLPTIQKLTEVIVLQNCNFTHRLNHKIKTSWQLPWMVSYHPLDGHPPSEGQGWSPNTSIPGMVAYQP